MTKKQIRNEFQLKRNEFTSLEIHEMSKMLNQHFISSKWFQKEVFHVYIGVLNLREIDTSIIIESLWHAEKTVITPKMKAKELLSCHYHYDSELERNSWGILEPRVCEELPISSIDIVLVPMLICDVLGNRIGYGGGYYDRFMSELRPDVQLIGINFFQPIEHVPSEHYDIPLDALITPQGIISFK
ncbi:MAG: 5-formyltetrahydrofolate cyclo-ligase [Flavobacteriaceae bacterium]|nr:5-formyltetrahydrofolate cyclo-ligase [Flavobacteriaceae bacterium]